MDKKTTSKLKYKHQSGSSKRKKAEQKALQDAGRDAKQQKLSEKFFVQPQVKLLFIFIFYTS